MYYRLNPWIQRLWNLSFFIGWVCLTVWLMRVTMTFALRAGARNYEFTREVGINPAISDLGNLFFAVVVFFVVPLTSTVVVILVNKALKGKNPHEFV